jgi:hypothetical protein
MVWMKMTTGTVGNCLLRRIGDKVQLVGMVVTNVERLSTVVLKKRIASFYID